MVVLPQEQGNGYAANLEQGGDDVCHSLKTFLNDVVRGFEVCKGSPGNERDASEVSNCVGPPAKKKN